MQLPHDAWAAEQNRLGLASAGRGDLAAAEAHFRAAIGRAPLLAQAHNNLGVALEMQGRLGEAETAYRQSLAAKPDYADGWQNLGVVLERLGKFDLAEAACRRALAFNPGSATAANGLGVALMRLDRLAESAALLAQVATHCPDFAAAHSNYGAVLEKLGRLEEAAAALEHAIALEPDNVGALVNAGLLYDRLGKTEAARAAFERAMQFQPDCAEAEVNLGLGQIRSGEIHPSSPAAEKLVRKALELDRNSVEARFNLGVLQLRDGEFAEGWAGYRFRNELPDAEPPRPPVPLWDGSPLAGRTILLCKDQGAGDEIQFVRFCDVLARQGARVIVLCSAPLRQLLATCPGVAAVMVQGDPWPPADCYLMMADVPGLLGTDLTSIPANVPYLFPPADLASQWKQELDSGSDLKVGLAWQGNPRNPLDRERSFPLTAARGLTHIAGTKFYSLQFGAGREQVPGSGCNVSDLGNRLGPFHETAAFVQNLDLVITCDSSPAHLAGALGVPVWVALAHFADWRWLRERSDSPWYPTMRLFRQPRPGAWDAVFEEIESALRGLLAERRSGR